MKFDQTYIAIRRRGILEIFDLAMHLVRDHFGPLFTLWFVGVVPFAVANWYVTRWMTVDYFQISYLALYFFTISLLIINQAQIATAFVTAYLGQAMFSRDPSVWACLKQTLRINPWFFWLQGIYRCVLPVWILVFWMDENGSEETFVMLYTLFLFFVLGGLIIRCFRPFATEILLLEKTPIRATYPGEITYKIRSAGLHSVADTQRLTRFVALSLFAVFLTISLFGSMMLIDSWINLHASDLSVPALVYLPLSIWMVAGLYAVVRFLSYIDIRIRQEGWEVELRIRTESMRVESTPL